MAWHGIELNCSSGEMLACAVLKYVRYAWWRHVQYKQFKDQRKANHQWKNNCHDVTKTNKLLHLGSQPSSWTAGILETSWDASMPVLLSTVAWERKCYSETSHKHQLHHKTVPSHGKKREVLEQLLVTSRWSTASFISWRVRKGLKNCGLMSLEILMYGAHSI